MGATDTRAQIQHTRIINDPRDGDHHHDVEDGGAERNRWRSIAGVTSPFELMPARSRTSTGRIQSPARSIREERTVYTDGGRTRGQEEERRRPLSFLLDRQDIPYVPPTTRDVRMPYTTSAFATRMTPREQPRIEQDAEVRRRTTADESPTWLEYQRRHADELDEGRRAIERIAAATVDTGDEPYIYTGPRPLLVGGHDQHAVRMDPQTRKCDNASQAGINRGATGQVRNAAGLRRDEFHTAVPFFTSGSSKEPLPVL